jgi:uncharacterized protein (DUF433 family)
MAILAINHIERTAGVCGGKPRIAGRRVTVKDVVVFHNLNGWSVEQIGEELDLTPGQIYAALSFYYDHQQEIDDSIVEADSLAHKLGKPLRDITGKIDQP